MGMFLQASLLLLHINNVLIPVGYTLDLLYSYNVHRESLTNLHYLLYGPDGQALIINYY